MGVLKNLDGVSKTEVEAVFIEKVSDIKKILREGKAATDAGFRGAINIWCDDAGIYRCEAIRFLRTIEEKKFKKLSEVEEWAVNWIKKIN